MNITIISMKDSSRRLRFSNVNKIFFDAVTNNDNCSFNESVSTLIYGRKLKDSEVGCSLSHKEVMKNLEFKNYWEVILEDDAIITKEFYDFVEEFSGVKFNAPSIIILGHSKTSKKFLWLQRLKQPLFNVLKYKTIQIGTTHRVLRGCGTVGYAINEAAAKIINDSEIVFWLADDWEIINNMGVEIYQLKSPIIWEDMSLVSSIGNQTHVEHDFIRSPLSNWYMVIKHQAIRIKRGWQCFCR